MKKNRFGLIFVTVAMLASCGPKQSEEKTFTVTWQNYDGTVLEIDTKVKQNSNPSYDGAKPTKPETASHRYEFSGWSPALSPVISDVTYTACFTEKPLTYTVTWQNYDGTVLETDTNVEKNADPHYDGATPTKPDTEESSFLFKGWSPALSPVISDVTYTAQFEEVAKPEAIQKQVVSIAVDRLNSDISALVFYVDEQFTTKGLKLEGTLGDGRKIDVLPYCTFKNTEIEYSEDEGHYVDVTHTPTGCTCRYWISIYVPAEKDKEVTSVTISDTSIDIDQKITLSATVKPEETYWKQVSWTVSDSSIATIDAKTGEVTGLKEGKATITATSVRYPKRFGSATLTVTKAEHDYGEVKISKALEIAKTLPSYQTEKFVNSKQHVTIKGKAFDVIDFVLTSAEDGGNKKPGKTVLVDETGYILAASETGANTLYQNAKKYLDKPSLGSTYYTIKGTVATYRGVPEIQVESFTWSETAHVEPDLPSISTSLDSGEAFFDNIKNCWCSNNGNAVKSLNKIVGHCVNQVDENSYIFADKNDNTFAVYKQFGTGFAVGNEYELRGLSTVYKWRGSFRVLEAEQISVKTSTFDIKAHSNSTTIAALSTYQEPTNYEIDENYLRCGSLFFNAPCYVGFYQLGSGNYYYVLGDNYKVVDPDLGYYSVATSKTDVTKQNAVWISNDLYWNVDPGYLEKGALAPYALDLYSGLTEDQVKDFQTTVYFTLNILEHDTGVSNTKAWKLNVIEDLVEPFGPEPEGEKTTLALTSATETEYIASTSQTWANDIVTIKQEKNGSNTFYRENNPGRVGKNCKLSISLNSSDKKISCIVFHFKGTYSFLADSCFGDNILASDKSALTQTVVLTEEASSFVINKIVLANGDNSSKIYSIEVYYK